jgi:hypothetical protein
VSYGRQTYGRLTATQRAPSIGWVGKIRGAQCKRCFARPAEFHARASREPPRATAYAPSQGQGCGKVAAAKSNTCPAAPWPSFSRTIVVALNAKEASSSRPECGNGGFAKRTRQNATSGRHSVRACVAPHMHWRRRPNEQPVVGKELRASSNNVVAHHRHPKSLEAP